MKPLAVLVVYSVKESSEAAFKPLLKKHWPTLNQVGLVTQTAPKFWRSTDHRKPGVVSYLETMEWKDESSPETAHQTPEVMAIWEPMGPMLENLQIFHMTPVTL